MMAECEFKKMIVVGVSIKIVKTGMNMHNKGWENSRERQMCLCVLEKYGVANVV